MESIRTLTRTALPSDSREYRPVETMNPVNLSGNELTTAGENKRGKKGEHWELYHGLRQLVFAAQRLGALRRPMCLVIYCNLQPNFIHKSKMMQPAHY